MNQQTDDKSDEALKQYFATFGNDQVASIICTLRRQCKDIKQKQLVPPFMLDPCVKLSMENLLRSASIEYRVMTYLKSVFGSKFEICGMYISQKEWKDSLLCAAYPSASVIERFQVRYKETN